ncbi:hypothetical protein D3C86_645310 [compost metagenome]
MAAVSHGFVKSLVVTMVCTCAQFRPARKVTISASVPRMALITMPSRMLFSFQRASSSVSRMLRFVLSRKGDTISVGRVRPMAPTTGDTSGFTAPRVIGGIVSVRPVGRRSSS